MATKRHSKLVHEGEYVAEVDVDLIVMDAGWSPCLSLEDAYKLDEVRAALRQGDLKTASGLGRVYRLTPVSVWTSTPSPCTRHPTVFNES